LDKRQLHKLTKFRYLFHHERKPIIVAVFYVAAITHILPLPESALTRLSGFSSNVMDVLFACGSWVIRHVVD
jgi:hypothetical protein